MFNLELISSLENNDTWYVYILECKDSTYYTSMTSDIVRRFDEHQKGNGAKYTKGRLPIKLMYFETLSSRSAAIKREVEIKHYSRIKKKELIALAL